MWASSLFYRQGLNYLTSNVKRITFCSCRPSGPTTAWKTGGLYCKARSSKVTCGAYATTTVGYTVKITSSTAAIAVTSSGKANHVALLGTTAQLLYVTMCTSKALAVTDTVNWPKFNVRIATPTSS